MELDPGVFFIFWDDGWRELFWVNSGGTGEASPSTNALTPSPSPVEPLRGGGIFGEVLGACAVVAAKPTAPCRFRPGELTAPGRAERGVNAAADPDFRIRTKLPFRSFPSPVEPGEGSHFGKVELRQGILLGWGAPENGHNAASDESARGRPRTVTRLDLLGNHEEYDTMDHEDSDHAERRVRWSPAGPDGAHPVTSFRGR